jgi:hypothetical protein
MVIGSMLSTEKKKKKNIFFLRKMPFWDILTPPPYLLLAPGIRAGTTRDPETFSGSRNFFSRISYFCIYKPPRLHPASGIRCGTGVTESRDRSHGVTGPESRSHGSGNGTRNTKPEPDMGMEPESRSHGSENKHGNGNGVTAPESRCHGFGNGHRNGTGIAESDSRDRT